MPAASGVPQLRMSRGGIPPDEWLVSYHESLFCPGQDGQDEPSMV